MVFSKKHISLNLVNSFKTLFYTCIKNHISTVSIMLLGFPFVNFQSSSYLSDYLSNPENFEHYTYIASAHAVMEFMEGPEAARDILRPMIILPSQKPSAMASKTLSKRHAHASICPSKLGIFSSCSSEVSKPHKSHTHKSHKKH
jgi:hypothetical protein